MKLFISKIGVGHDTFPAKQGRSIMAERGYIGVAYCKNHSMLSETWQKQHMFVKTCQYVSYIKTKKILLQSFESWFLF